MSLPWRAPWSVEDERALWIAAGNHKDRDAQATLCEGYESLIRLVADRKIRKVYPRLLSEIDDVVQEVHLNLIKAWNRAGYKFPLTQKDGTLWNGSPFWRFYVHKVVSATTVQFATRRRTVDEHEVPLWDSEV